MEFKVILLHYFICTLCVINYANSAQIHQNLRVKRYAQKHNNHVPIGKMEQVRFNGPPGHSDYRGPPYYEEPKAHKGPPDHRGPPDNKRSSPHKGPRPPPNRGPPDHHGNPNRGPGDKEIKEPYPNNDFGLYPINNQHMGEQSITSQNNVNAIKPENDKKVCNLIYTGNVAIYEYEGKPVFQVVPVTPES